MHAIATTSVAALSLHGVNVRHGKIVVCRDVDLRVKAAEIVALIGPNGAGKSSLLGAIAGSVSSSGDVSLRGVTVSGLPAHKRANIGVSFVPEVRGNVFGPLSVEENLEMGVQLLKPEDRSEMIRYIHKLFPILRDRLATPAFMLSGGEQQMLAIGMAVGRNPSLLLLDEPTQGLAPSVYDILEEAIGALKQRGIAILLAEQNLPFARRLAERFVALVDGQIAAAGTREQLGDEGAIHKLFF